MLCYRAVDTTADEEGGGRIAVAMELRNYGDTELRRYGTTEASSMAADKRIHESTELRTYIVWNYGNTNLQINGSNTIY